MNPIFAAAVEAESFCRARGWRIAVRQHGRLDESLIWAELTPLLELKEAPEAAERLKAILAGAKD